MSNPLPRPLYILAWLSGALPVLLGLLLRWGIRFMALVAVVMLAVYMTTHC